MALTPTALAWGSCFSTGSGLCALNQNDGGAATVDVPLETWQSLGLLKKASLVKFEAPSGRTD